MSRRSLPMAAAIRQRCDAFAASGHVPSREMFGHCSCGFSSLSLNGRSAHLTEAAAQWSRASRGVPELTSASAAVAHRMLLEWTGSFAELVDTAAAIAAPAAG